MRVIAGMYRSRVLASPKGTETRPTSDRLRETLFNILSPRLSGCRFVDLYAGTGAVGIEAISRGAEHVWFAEKAQSAVSCLRGNLEALKIKRGYTVEEGGTGAMLERLVKFGLAVDVVFLDPPYVAAEQYESTLGFFGSKKGMASLGEGAVVVAEHSSKAELAERYGGLHCKRGVKQGDAALSFFEKASVSQEA